MKQLLALLLVLMLFIPAAIAEEGSFYQPIPDVLRFTQVTSDKEYLRKDVWVRYTLPETANDQVNAEMRDLILAMSEAGRPALNRATTNKQYAYVDTGANIFRTGASVMSFLTTTRASVERQQVYVDFDARVYDIATGERLTLASIFDADSAAWDLLAAAVRDQLSAYFPDQTADPAVLDVLCSHDGLLATPFTLTPARLSLHYRANALYPGQDNTLMHVDVYYPALRPLMNAYGQAQTDNSHYRVIALTYDDGPAMGSSNTLQDKLREYGANVTFFITGINIKANHDILCREHDTGHEVASHGWQHEYLTNSDKKKVLDWKERMDNAMLAYIGTVPHLMRAPGGTFSPYSAAGQGLPLIHWSIISGDAVDVPDVNGIIRNLEHSAKPGAIVLMHDIKSDSPRYSEGILKNLEESNYLCVTISELFSHCGIPLEPDVVYHSCVDEAAAMTQVSVVTLSTMN